MSISPRAADAVTAHAGHHYHTRHKGKHQHNGETQQVSECCKHTTYCQHIWLLLQAGYCWGSSSLQQHPAPSSSSLGQSSRDVVTTSIDNGLPGVWQCLYICCNLAGWDLLKELHAFLLALILMNFVVGVEATRVPEPLVHICIYPSVHMLYGLVAIW